MQHSLTRQPCAPSTNWLPVHERCCSRSAWQTRPPAAIQQLCLDTLRDVRATAILDHYRRLKQQMTGSFDSFDSASTSSLDDDDTPCPLECVREVKTVEEFNKVIESASPRTLVVVDFFRTACGACKYIQPGFTKLCKRSGDHHAPVVFLKHNVIDEYDERTELADQVNVCNVPMFQYYMNGKLVEQFATRDKTRISLSIDKYVPGAVSL